MGVLDELNKLKQARRDEIAAAEEARRQAEEAAKAEFLRRLNVAVEDILGELSLMWLKPLALPQATVWENERRAAVTFDVPGHMPVQILLRRTGTDTWILAHPPSCGGLPWCVTAPGGGETHFTNFADAMIFAEIPGWTPPAPKPDDALSPEVMLAAHRAWGAMTQTDPEQEPMPPAVAIDHVQDETGDRDDAVSAIHLAAGEWLDSLRPEQPVVNSPHWPSATFATSVAVRGYLLGEEYNLADNCRAEIVNACGEVIHDFHQRGDDSIYSADDVNIAHAWLTWIPAAERAIDLCRAVAAAAHPEPASAT